MSFKYNKKGKYWLQIKAVTESLKMDTEIFFYFITQIETIDTPYFFFILKLS